MEPDSSQGAGQKVLGANRRLWILLAILVLTAAISAFQWGRSPSREKSDAYIGNHRIGRDVGSADDPIVLLSVLQKSPQEYTAGQRNLFGFYQPPPPPVPVQKRAANVPPPQPVAVCGDRVCQPGEDYQNCPTDCQPPPPPEIGLKYIGYLSEDDQPVVFLTDGKEIFMGRVNDVIANKYRILKITDESVELGYLNLNQSRTIPFQGNNKN